MKQKYGEQDEEERQAMMELLGSKKTTGFDIELRKGSYKYNLVLTNFCLQTYRLDWFFINTY